MVKAIRRVCGALLILIGVVGLLFPILPGWLLIAAGIKML